MIPAGWTNLDEYDAAGRCGLGSIPALGGGRLSYATASLLAILDGELPIDLADGTRRRVLGRLLLGVAERAAPGGTRAVVREVAVGTRVSWRVTRPPTAPDGSLLPEAAPVVLADGALVLPDDVIFVYQADDSRGDADGYWLAMLRSDVPRLLTRRAG